MSGPVVDVVVPTIGRPSLATLLAALVPQSLPGTIRIVDDRVAAPSPLPVEGQGVQVLAGRGAGPASARNLGWRASDAEWVAFVDDDVVVAPDWVERLLEDLTTAGDEVAAVQGRLHVPLPDGRRPTDWERNVAALETGQWITADLAVRRCALAEVAGFDERFPRAYREDADLALRLLDRGHRLVTGRRRVTHPVAPAPWSISIAKQRGNADDALVRRIHGPDWRQRAGAPPGTLRRHAAMTAAGVVAGAAALAGRHRLAAAAATGWVAGWAGFARRRIAPGPRTPGEVAAMAVTSAVVPAAAVWHRLAGEVRARRLARLPGPRPLAVLFDRDGTLVIDVAYNGDPARVAPASGAVGATARLREAGLGLGLVTNQSGVARGLLSRASVDAVNRRVEELLGPFDTVVVCPHGVDDGCDCRKPRPGLIDKAAAELGVRPTDCVVVGDIGSDVGAALAAGARAVLVPTPATRLREVLACRWRRGVAVAPDLTTATDIVLGVRR